jgi:hypothetical protein
VTPHAPFLTDEPDSLGQDAFGHTDYADALHSIVTDPRPPLTVGLFGPWGVGKSSIIGALQEELEGDPDTAFVYFDAWRYEDDSLRRQFLLDVATDLESDGRLSKFEVKKELRDVDYETQEVEESLGWHWPRVARLLILGGVFGAFALIAALLGAFPALLAGSFGRKLLFALATAVIAALAGALSQAIAVDAVTFTRRRLEDPDRFAAKFADLLGALKPGRLVIAIDNLDRSSPEKAVEVLATIKTYLEPTVSPDALPRSGARPSADKKIVFVIAVDDEALRRHMIAKEQQRRTGAEDGAAARYVEEYLAKFFGARLPIRQILDDDMRDYVAGYITPLAEARGLEEGPTRDLITVVNAGLRGNPRGVKQFHNDLEVRLRLLEEREREREGGRPRISPPLSGEVAMVAKLALIEREWPDAFARLQADPLLFESWIIDARDGGLVDWSRMRDGAVGSALPVAGAAPLPEQRRLATFLRNTARVESPRLGTLLSLKQAKFEIELPRYTEFRDALIADERERVVELLESASAEERARLAGHVPDILAEELGRGYIDAARSILDVLVSTDAFAAHEEVRREVIRVAADEPTLRGEMPNLDPVAVLRTGELLDPPTRRRLFVPFLELYHDVERSGDERAVLARALSPYVGEFSSGQRARVAGAIGGALRGEFELYLPFIEVDDSLLAGDALDSALEALEAPRAEGPGAELPGPLHRRAAAFAVVRIGMGTSLGDARGGRLLGIVTRIFEGSVGTPSDLEADLPALRELVGTVDGEHPDEFSALGRSFQEHFAEIQESRHGQMIEFAGEVLARCPEEVGAEVASVIADRVFAEPGSALAVVSALDPVPDAFRLAFLQRLDALKAAVEFWPEALGQLQRIDPEGFPSRLIGFFDQLFRAEELDAVSALLDRYADVLAHGGEPFRSAAAAVIADRLAQGNPGPPRLLGRLVVMLGDAELDDLSRPYADALAGPYGEATRTALEELPGEAESLRLLTAHHALERIDSSGPPPPPLLALVASSIGQLGEEEQDRFAERLAVVIRNWPGQAGGIAAGLMATERLPVGPSDVLAEALIEAEPNLGDVEPRSEALRAVWHLRVRRGSRVWKRLERRASELGEGEGEVERELARRVKEWMEEGQGSDH